MEGKPMMWTLAHRFDPLGAQLADRHYNRRKVGSPQFVPPGRCLVLTARTATGTAVWVTSWPFPEYVKHRWGGAWVNSLFRSEGAGRASTLIKQAVAATLSHYGAPPELGMVTFIDRDKVRAKDNPGHSYIIAGFRPDGFTEGGLVALRMPPDRMPEPQGALGTQAPLPLSAAALQAESGGQ